MHFDQVALIRLGQVTLSIGEHLIPLALTDEARTEIERTFQRVLDEADLPTGDYVIHIHDWPVEP